MASAPVHEIAITPITAATSASHADSAAARIRQRVSRSPTHRHDRPLARAKHSDRASDTGSNQSRSTCGDSRSIEQNLAGCVFMCAVAACISAAEPQRSLSSPGDSSPSHDPTFLDLPAAHLRHRRCHPRGAAAAHVAAGMAADIADMGRRQAGAETGRRSCQASNSSPSTSKPPAASRACARCMRPCMDGASMRCCRCKWRCAPIY